jgi:hypothetical protein
VSRFIVEESERDVRKTEEPGRFFHDLENEVFDRAGLRVWQRVEIEGHNRNAVRELFW